MGIFEKRMRTTKNREKRAMGGATSSEIWRKSLTKLPVRMWWRIITTGGARCPVFDVHILLMHLQRVHICDSSRGMASTSCVGLAYDTHGIPSGGLLHYEVQCIETISIKTCSLKDQCGLSLFHGAAPVRLLGNFLLVLLLTRRFDTPTSFIFASISGSR